MVVLHNAIAEVYHLQAVHTWEQGGDPEPAFALAREQLAVGLAEAPGHALFHQNLAWTAYFQGKVRLRSGRNPEPYLDEALSHAERALKLSNLPEVILCVASVYRLKAEAVVKEGGDPSSRLEQAHEALSRVLKLNPDHPEAFRSLGRLYTLEGQWRAATGGDPLRAFERAREALDRALVLEPNVAYFHLALARWALERDRRQPSAEIRELGLKSVEKAIQLRPGWPEALDLRATWPATPASGSLKAARR